jgi:hypothetical protein
MQISDIEGRTRVIGESQGYRGLPLRDETITCAVNGPETPCMVTAWRPTEEELAAIIAGKPVNVRILGTSHPPIMLYVEPAEEPARPDKPILCLDFDGVVHSYSSGWKGAANIPDPPVSGAIAFLREAVEHFTVAIYSSRSGQPGGIQAMCEWLGYWVCEQRLSDDEDLSWPSAIQWPRTKPAAQIGIDDRVLTFDGTWPPMDALLAFKPWNKR